MSDSTTLSRRKRLASSLPLSPKGEAAPIAREFKLPKPRPSPSAFVDLHAEDAQKVVDDPHVPPDDGVLLTTLLTSDRSCLVFCAIVLVVFVCAVGVLYTTAWVALTRMSYSHTYESGFRWGAGLWMFAQLPLWLFILFATPSKKQRLAWVVQVIFVICFVTYLLKGLQVLPVYYDLLGHELYPVRYVEWGLTTPMMLLLLCNLGKRDVRSSLRLVTEDVLMIAMGFIATIGPSVAFLLFALTTSFVFFALTLADIHYICSEYRATLKDFPRIYRSMVFLEVWLFIVYSAMPSIWMLGALEYLDDEQVSEWYFISETAGKLLYSGILLIVNFEIIDYHERLTGEREKAALEAKVQAEESEHRLALEERRHLEERHDLIRRNHERMQEFLRYFLHEVRVPLNSVVLSLESLRSDKAGAITLPNPLALDVTPTGHGLMLENRMREVDMAGVDMWRETQRMTQVVNSVLSLQQFSDERVWLDSASSSLQHVCERAVKAVQADAERSHITLAARIDRRIPRVLTDETRLSQMLMTLLTNAIMFTPYRSDRINLVRLSLTRCADFTSIDPVIDQNLPPLTLESDDATGDDEPLPSPGERICVRISVRDTGFGLSEADLANIFRPYVHISAGEELKGKKTGVDLAICRAIADLMGGRVGVSSREGLGSEFFIEVPFTVSKDQAPARPSRLHPMHRSMQLSPSTALAPLSASESASSRSNSRSASPSPGPSPSSTTSSSSSASSASTRASASDSDNANAVLPSPSVLLPASSEPSALPLPIRRVLIVEDVHLNRKLLSNLIKKKTQADVDEAVNGQVAVDKVRHNIRQYDVILCDSEMPVKNGPDAVREMREMGVVCPIIGVTANALLDDQRAFIACGLDDLVTKPVNIRILLLAMERAMRRRGG